MLNRQALLNNEAVFGESMLLELRIKSAAGAKMVEIETSIGSQGTEHAACISENAPDVSWWWTVDQCGTQSGWAVSSMQKSSISLNDCGAPKSTPHVEARRLHYFFEQRDLVVVMVSVMVELMMGIEATHV